MTRKDSTGAAWNSAGGRLDLNGAPGFERRVEPGTERFLKLHVAVIEVDADHGSSTFIGNDPAWKSAAAAMAQSVFCDNPIGRKMLLEMANLQRGRGPSMVNFTGQIELWSLEDGAFFLLDRRLPS